MIRTCLFDMGNVLVRFSHERMCEQLAGLCGLAGSDVRRILIDSGVQLDFERGRWTELDFHLWFSGEVEREIELDAFRHASSDIFELNEPVVPILDALRSAGIRLVLLSNTSVSHFQFVKARFDLLDRFDDFVVSYEAGAVKPEPGIYEAALRVIGCAPSECFYTDDIPAYVEAGRRFGLEADVFTDAEALRGHLAARGVATR